MKSNHEHRTTCRAIDYTPCSLLNLATRKPHRTKDNWRGLNKGLTDKSRSRRHMPSVLGPDPPIERPRCSFGSHHPTTVHLGPAASPDRPEQNPRIGDCLVIGVLVQLCALHRRRRYPRPIAIHPSQRSRHRSKGAWKPREPPDLHSEGVRF